MSSEWVREYDSRRFKMAIRAKEAGMMESRYVDAVEAMLRQRVLHAEIRVRVSEQALVGILGDGRFKAWAEVGSTSSAMSSPEHRFAAEQKIFGISKSAAPDTRPIYGYLEGSYECDPLTRWGSIVLGLDAVYARQATFTLGDTVDATLTDPAFVPVPVGSPDIRAVSLNKTNALKAVALGDLSDAGYAEVQLHGHVPANAIRRVVYTRAQRPTANALELLEQACLTPETVAADDPGAPPTD